jgi:hypothetical protein
MIGILGSPLVNLALVIAIIVGYIMWERSKGIKNTIFHWVFALVGVAIVGVYIYGQIFPPIPK